MLILGAGARFVGRKPEKRGAGHLHGMPRDSDASLQIPSSSRTRLRNRGNCSRYYTVHNITKILTDYMIREKGTEMNSKTLTNTCKAIDELSGLQTTPLSLDTIECRYYRLGAIEDMYFQELDEVRNFNAGDTYLNLSDDDQEVLIAYHNLLDEEKSRLRNSGTDKNVIADAYMVLGERWDKVNTGEQKPLDIVVYSLRGEPADGIWDIILPSITLAPNGAKKWSMSLLQSPLWVYRLLKDHSDRNMSAKRNEISPDTLSAPYNDLTTDEIQAVLMLWNHRREHEFSDIATVVAATKKLL